MYFSSSREQLCTKPLSKETWTWWRSSWRPELPSRKETRWEVNARHRARVCTWAESNGPCVCAAAGGHGGPLGLQGRQPTRSTAAPRPRREVHVQRQGRSSPPSTPVLHLVAGEDSLTKTCFCSVVLSWTAPPSMWPWGRGIVSVPSISSTVEQMSTPKTE